MPNYYDKSGMRSNAYRFKSSNDYRSADPTTGSMRKNKFWNEDRRNQLLQGLAAALSSAGSDNPGATAASFVQMWQEERERRGARQHELEERQRQEAREERLIGEDRNFTLQRDETGHTRQLDVLDRNFGHDRSMQEQRIEQNIKDREDSQQHDLDMQNHRNNFSEAMNEREYRQRVQVLVMQDGLDVKQAEQRARVEGAQRMAELAVELGISPEEGREYGYAVATGQRDSRTDEIGRRFATASQARAATKAAGRDADPIKVNVEELLEDGTRGIALNQWDQKPMQIEVDPRVTGGQVPRYIRRQDGKVVPEGGGASGGVTPDKAAAAARRLQQQLGSAEAAREAINKDISDPQHRQWMLSALR